MQSSGNGGENETRSLLSETLPSRDIKKVLTGYCINQEARSHLLNMKDNKDRLNDEETKENQG